MLVENKNRKLSCLFHAFRTIAVVVALYIAVLIIKCPFGNDISPPAVSSRDITDFRLQWCRLQKWRVDWEQIMSPCLEGMKWEMRDVKSRQRTSARKSYISKWEIQTAGHFSRIWIQSVDMDGQKKTFGGDSWRVYIRQGPASLAPLVIDHDNGLYEVLVLVLEPGTYSAGIYLDYTLCNGLRNPPDKFFIDGTNQGLYVNISSDLLGDLRADFINTPLQHKTAFKFTVPSSTISEGYFKYCRDASSCSRLTQSCGLSCRLLWDGHGRWVNNTWKPYSPVSLRKPKAPLRDYLVNIGDSNGRRFSQLAAKQNLCKRVFKRCDLVMNWIYRHGDARPKVSKGEDFKEEIVIDEFREILKRPQLTNSSSVFLFNMGIHQALALNFSQFQSLLTSVIALLQEHTVSGATPRSNMDIVWRGTTLIEREKLAYLKKRSINGTLFRFHNNQRVQLYHTYSMAAMCKAGFKVLDMYPLTASYPYGTYDNVHYKLDAFLPAVRALEDHYGHDS